MKSLVALIFTIALACNAALAGIGGLIYCVEKDSGKLCIVSVENSPGNPEGCCPFEQTKSLSSLPLPFDCDDCTDYEVDVSEEGAASSVDRVVVKATAAIGWISMEFFFTRSESAALKNAPARVPPILNGASQLFANTVMFRV